MPSRLGRKTAPVSGSTQGFGRRILETFIREGAMILRMHLQATNHPTDGCPEDPMLAEEQDRKKAVAISIAKFGKAPCVVVVHNAGWLYLNKFGLDVNVQSIHLACKILMEKNSPGPTIVISSENTIRPGVIPTWYNDTKSMALEFARRQLRFNPICPTFGNTPLLNRLARLKAADFIQAKGKAIPTGRFLKPCDVANVALFLAAPPSSIISGVEFLVVVDPDV